MLRRGFPKRMSYGTGVEQKLSQMRLEQIRQRERAARTSSRFTVEKRDPDLESTFIGIDLGTTNSCMTYIDPETKLPKVIPSPSGSWVYPTAITFDKNHTVRLCGEDARAVARTSSSATLCSGKRLIGRKYGELGRVSGQLGKTNVLHVNERGEVSVECAGRSYTVTHVIAIFLRHMKKMAEEYLQKPVDACVVSVPAYFTPQQKVATEDAALIAGFDVLEVIDEPSAACLSYTVLRQAAKKPPKAEKEVSLVFDLGGGTLDCAIMEHDSPNNTFSLVATHGDPILGGNDWDNVLANDMADTWQKKWRIDIESTENRFGGAVEHRILQLEAEKAKVHFSHSLDDYIGYQRSFHFSETRKDLLPLEVKYSFQDYLRLTAPLRERCRHCVERILEESGYKPEQIHNVLLVGAMTRDPPIRRDLEKHFGIMPTAADECPPDYAVAIGAGVRAGMLMGMFPHLSESTRFVRGSRQSMTTGGVLQRAANFVFSKMEQNPNAIGQRWRGIVKGLDETDIERYAKELVEFEATSERRLMLDRVEGEANDAMQRVARNNYRKQGMQEKTVKQLTDQLKFWQYMVRNFHDHEEHLARVVGDLNQYMDSVEGYAKDASDEVTEDGKIDFDKLREKRAKMQEESLASTAEASLHQRQEEGRLEDAVDARLTAKGKAKAGESVIEGATQAGVEPEAQRALDTFSQLGDFARPASDQEATRKLGKTKVLRREIPLLKTATVEEIVERGTPAFVSDRTLDSEMSESTRQALFKDYVQERAWREPPAPPGESGSWGDVKKMLDAGETVGAPISQREVNVATERARTPNDRMAETLAWLEDTFPTDFGASEIETLRCNSARIFDSIDAITPNRSTSAAGTLLRGHASGAA
jgi:molecular chaperone DnaK (HSP70)